MGVSRILFNAYDQWRSQDFSEGEASDDTIVGGSGGMPPRKLFDIWVSETAFPAF